MLDGKKEQSVGAGAFAVQAGGDANVNVLANISTGMSVSDVKDICELVWKSNFPILREEALEEARANMQAFSSKLEAKISDAIARIDIGRFREPDVQAMLNDAVQSSARRGAAANTDVLCALIAERVSHHHSDFKDIVLSEAAIVVPKLTAAQIAMLVFMHLVMEMRVTENENATMMFEALGAAVEQLCSPAYGLSPVQRSHVVYAGACSTSNTAFAYNVMEHLKDQYGYSDKVAFVQDFRKRCPSYFALIEAFERERFGRWSLTSVGRAIALARLSSVLRTIDFATWIH